MGRCRVALLLTLGAFAATTASGAEREAPRAVVELFTSQGCSSCPAADRLLGELANDPSLVVMSLPIDYWDYLGWKDTLAKPRHTARQRGYAQSRGDREVYTPQVVVNGLTHVLGSDKVAIEHAIQETRSQPETLSQPIKLSLGGDQLVVTAPNAETTHPSAEIWLCALTKRVPVTIARGENRGRTITYNNVVRRWLKVGDWTGAAHSWTIPATDLTGDGIDMVAVIVQAGSSDKPGKMLGAATASVR